MPVAVIAALMVLISGLAVSAEGGCICAGNPETLPPSGTAISAPRANDPEQTAARCEEAVSNKPASVPRCDEPARSAAGEGKLEPTAMPGGVVLIAIAIVVMLGTIEALFRCSIYERRDAAADHRQTEKNGVNVAPPGA